MTFIYSSLDESIFYTLTSHMEVGLQFPIPFPVRQEEFIKLSLNITQGKGCLLIFSICKIHLIQLL